MRKILLSVLAAVTVLPLSADEGMWTLYNLPHAVYEQMRSEGFAMPYSHLYESENAIKNACVNFGGFCSGVVVSRDGLVFTNHHCGFEAIRSHSTVEHDYMLNGFIAKSYDEELPNKDLFVSFMVSQRDITEELNAKGLESRKGKLLEAFIDSVENVMEKAVKAQDSTLRLEIKPFYEGNKYYATTYRDFRDVRLVFAIPKSMGKFGGETDNWMWPRQTCDFSVFRIYADPKTNGPAEYSKDNVPYHPASWAPVSMDGYREGDFSMTIGYPGSTNRYLSSYGIRERRDAVNEPIVNVRTVKQDIMIRHMRASEAVRIKYDSKYAHSSNYWKNSIGMNKCIDSIGLIEQKQYFEKQMQRWMDTTRCAVPSNPRLDFDLLGKLYTQRLDIARTLTFWSETFLRSDDELTQRAYSVHNGMEVKGPSNKKKKQYIEFDDNSDQWDAATDREVLAALLKNYRSQVAQKYHPDFFKTVDETYGGDFTRYVDHMYATSILMKSGEPIYINKKGYDNDCAVVYGMDIVTLRDAIRLELDSISRLIHDQEKALCATKLRMEQDMPNYSDANFTMRLSYGQVIPLTVGTDSMGFYTTAESLYKKMLQGDRGTIDYQVEPEMKTLFSSDDYNPYCDPITGDMQLCFLTNNDITGGNSGSPMFNGKGELIGLAFDGNWDSLSSDIFFDSELARCIGVDIRYVLFMMDRWGHADRLLKEIGIK